MAENILHKLMYVVDEGFKPQGIIKFHKLQGEFRTKGVLESELVYIV